MGELEQLLGLFAAAVLLAAAARRVGAPYPVFLALGGALLAFVPGVPAFSVPPELALALFIAPILLDAAYDASPRDLRDNWLPLTSLVVFAVGLTTLAAAWVTRLLMPEMPWAPAIVLGAVVAPPDAAAATAVLRQLRPPRRIFDNLEAGESGRYLAVAGAVLVTVIAVRVGWHMAFNAGLRWRDRAFGFKPTRLMLRPTVGSGLVIAWAGMRGIVSLAAALALPATFPFGDLIVTTAFSVVLGTLIVQGLTLKPLLQWLNLRDDDPVGRERQAARARALQAGLAVLASVGSHVADAVRKEFAAHFAAEQEAVDGTVAERREHTRLHTQALQAARRAVLDMRAGDEIGDDAFHEVEEELDWLEMADGGKTA